MGNERPKYCSVCSKELGVWGGTKIVLYGKVELCRDCYIKFMDINNYKQNGIESEHLKENIAFFSNVYNTDSDEILASELDQSIGQYLIKTQNVQHINKPKIKIEEDTRSWTERKRNYFPDETPLYSIDGARGRHIDVYEKNW